MFRKIALGTVLALGSVSGALAWENIGEIDNPQTYMQQAPAFDAFASAPRHVKTPKVAPHMHVIVDRAGDVSNY